MQTKISLSSPRSPQVITSSEFNAISHIYDTKSIHQPMNDSINQYVKQGMLNGFLIVTIFFSRFRSLHNVKVFYK